MTVNGKATQPRTSWIEQFKAYTRGIASPKIFRHWAAIGAVSAALERRCWTDVGSGPLYPNLFLFLVGRPGVGKTQALSHAVSLCREVGLKVAPDDSTKPALVDFFSHGETRQVDRSSVALKHYHSVLSTAHELGTLIKEHDMEMLNFLSAMWDVPTVYEEHRRGRKEEPLLRIPNPSLVFLAGATPGYLSSIFPEVAWQQGFMARTVLVYSAHAVKAKLFGARDTTNTALRVPLVADLRRICQLDGEFIWAPDAASAMNAWYEADMPPVPTHSKLANYAVRRHMQVIKLCMVFSAARSDSRIIELEDYQAALDSLITAEHDVPEIFLEMSQNSDALVIQELHHYCMTAFLRDNKPIPVARLKWFLLQKIPTWKHDAILEAINDAEIITKSKNNPDYWIPNPQHQFGARK